VTHSLTLHGEIQVTHASHKEQMKKQTSKKKKKKKKIKSKKKKEKFLKLCVLMRLIYTLEFGFLAVAYLILSK